MKDATQFAASYFVRGTEEEVPGFRQVVKYADGMNTVVRRMFDDGVECPQWHQVLLTTPVGLSAQWITLPTVHGVSGHEVMMQTRIVRESGTFAIGLLSARLTPDGHKQVRLEPLCMRSQGLCKMIDLNMDRSAWLSLEPEESECMDMSSYDFDKHWSFGESGALVLK